MGLLSIFKSDPRNLIGPDVENAPTYEINLSDSILFFSCPPQNIQMPVYHGSNKFDIYTDTEVEIKNSTIATAKLFHSGWQFLDRPLLGIPYGCVVLNIVLVRNMSNEHGLSLLQEKPLISWICDRNKVSYGSENNYMIENQEEYAEPLIPENDFWQYPKSIKDFICVRNHNRSWVKYEIFQPSHAPTIIYETALSSDYAIKASWSPSAFETQYNSSSTNLREVVKNTIESIMSTMKIELSEELKQQYRDAGLTPP